MATAIQENGMKPLTNKSLNHVENVNNLDNAAEKDNRLFDGQLQPYMDHAEAHEEPPELDIVINNVVCSFSVRCHLNLREIALNGSNVEYRRENGMITMKLRRPYTTASIWSSGKVTCTGATSEVQAKIAARKFARSLQKLGFKVRFNNYRVVNVLGTCCMPFAIKITSFSVYHKENADYEPELHPGVTYKLKEPKATLKIFSTGSVTVTAPNVASVQAAIEHIYPLVYEFRKERSPEDELALATKKRKLNSNKKKLEEFLEDEPDFSYESMVSDAEEALDEEEGDDCRDSAEVNVTENMDNNQPSVELVPRTEQNNDESNANAENDEQRRKPQPSRLESFFAITKSLIIRALIIYFISSLFRRSDSNPKSPNAVSDNAVTHSQAVKNIFPNGTLFDLSVYLSESENFKQFNDPRSLIWFEEGLIYGDWYSGPNQDGSRIFEYSFVPSERLKQNGSIYLHIYITKSGKSPNPKAGKGVYAGDYISYSRKMLNKFKKIRYQKRHNLLTGESTASKEEIAKAELMDQEYVSHWHPNLTVNLVVDQTNWVYGQVPQPLDEYVHFLPGRNAYKPIIYTNDFWNMQRDYQPLNDTIEQLELRLTYQPLSLFKWQIYAAQSVRNKWTSSFMGEASDEDDNDQDTLKETLLETSPYLLGLTIIVSILHSVFEFLAFKNDIQFWNNRKSLEGLSVRSVFFNVFQSLIVLLYVLDNETNTVVRISCAIGLCIEVWKINKVIDINVNREVRVLGIFPKISFQDKGSYVESSTKEYDRLAFKYLSWALYPLLGGYAIYSLMYLEHKGWYSWVLSMLYGFLLTFGFIMMTPQLFINYKLKSVAHLPWRMLSYKFLNTFIDDIFAFVIKMPTLYRIGCFRDDIVFCIFLYQRWIYKTDHTRVNEFGFSGEMEAQLADSKKQVAINDRPKEELAKKNE